VPRGTRGLQKASLWKQVSVVLYQMCGIFRWEKPPLKGRYGGYLGRQVYAETLEV
jgi:hypothetical protein